jgi:hypothetical protein
MKGGRLCKLVKWQVCHAVAQEEGQYCELVMMATPYTVQQEGDTDICRF